MDNQSPYGTIVQPPKKRVSGQLIALIILGILFVIAGSLAIWSYMSYDKERTAVDSRISEAVAKGKKEQADADEAKFAEREKEPNRKFASPDDLGRVSFSYPKTWSVYESTPRSGSATYAAYLHPGVVPSIQVSDNKFALRVNIEQRAYDDYLKSLEGLVKSGKLRSSPFSANGFSGTRFDGEFNEKLRGVAVVFKIRDKVLIIRTDVEALKPDFEAIIKTISFNA